MMHVAVNDVDTSKAFYEETLGFRMVSDSGPGQYRWVPFELPGGLSFVLTSVHEHMKPGSLKLYFNAADLNLAYEELKKKNVDVGTIKDDLYGPASGVKWFTFKDPDGNHIFFVQG